MSCPFITVTILTEPLHAILLGIPAEGGHHTVSDTTPDAQIPDESEDECDSGFISPPGTPINDVTLGAPFGDDPGTTIEEPHLSTIGSVAPAALDPQPTGPPHPWIDAGCVWDARNWSCAYDTVFMSFWSIYQKSSPGWRDKWRQQAPEWNGFFREAFDALLTMAHNKRTSRTALSREFTSFRETFRDKLSQANPEYFRRHGAVMASVCRILNQIFSSSVGCEPHLDQVVACDQCGISVYNSCSFSLLGSAQLLDEYLNEDDIGPFLPLQTAVTRYVQRTSQEPQHDHCSTCSGPLRVESLHIPEMTWLWVELCDLVSPIIPSLRLVFGLPNQRQVYTLQAVIYFGGGHFTARLSDPSATWWKYDGMWRFGMPRIDRVEDEVDLLENDDRRAAFLLYRQENPEI